MSGNTGAGRAKPGRGRLATGRVFTALGLVLALGAAPLRADDDDGGGGAGAGGGSGDGASSDGAGWSATDGRGGLGPNPGRIPMPPSWHRSLDRLFGATPAPAPATGRASARADIVAAGLTPADLVRLRAQGFAVAGERAGLGMARLRGPAGLTEDQALSRLRALAPGAVADRNHRYRLAADAPPDEPTRPESVPAAGCAALPHGLLALVDTGVDARHPALAGRLARQESLRDPGRRPARTAHGTAVALRLAAALPEARLAVLDAFHLGPDGESADAYDLAAALARAGENGAVIANVSVVGPANAVVERLGAEASAKGVLFVAAAGNDGPRAAPLYPAAHPWAVAVTAVDATGRPWPRAAAGPHIDFAAHGVEVSLSAAPGTRPRRWSGTSFAAPLVTAALAMVPETGPARIERLAALARDAGAPGRDPVFGWGMVEPAPCDARLAAGINGSDTGADR